MFRRIYVVGLAALCVCALGAIAAHSASAEQRAYSCSKGAATKEFSDGHCLNKTEPKEYGHTLITETAAPFTPPTKEPRAEQLPLLPRT
jgi:hypothetical protein